MKGEEIIEFRGNEPKEPYVRTDRIAEDIADTIALELGWTEDEFGQTKEEIEEHLNFLNEWPSTDESAYEIVRGEVLKNLELAKDEIDAEKIPKEELEELLYHLREFMDGD